MDQWIDLFNSLTLSKHDSEVVRKFAKDPKGKSFLPAAEILKQHQLINESLELMISGVSLHPQYAVARVILARDLLQLGDAKAAWKTISESPVSLRDNVLAQKIKLKCAILLNDENQFNEILRHMALYKMQDEDVTNFRDIYNTSGFLQVQKKCVRQFAELGVTILIESQNSDKKAVDLSPNSGFIPDPKISTSDMSDLNGYHVMPLEAIFSVVATSKTEGADLEIDSLALGEVYEHQKLYSKALSIYRRLLLSPQNDYLRKKVLAMEHWLDREKLDTNNRKDDALTAVRPNVEADQERLFNLDRLTERIKFLNGLLHQLDRPGNH